uniref:Phosducin domain-containing protein n=1 Tax=Ganoderma boninense TaxID=34458 RepID=A0A5K1JZJ8_9APHY|nr:Phosducin domain-containing protein [Ganoderma boninense]
MEQTAHDGRGASPPSEPNSNLIPQDRYTTARISLIMLLSMIDNIPLLEVLVHQYAVPLATAQEYLDAHPALFTEARQRVLEQLRLIDTTSPPAGNLHAITQPTTPAPAAPAAPTDGASSDEEEEDDDEEDDEMEEDPPPTTTPPPPPPRNTEGAPTTSGEESSAPAQRVPTPEPDRPYFQLPTPPVAMTHLDRQLLRQRDQEENPDKTNRKKKKKTKEVIFSASSHSTSESAHLSQPTSTPADPPPTEPSDKPASTYADAVKTPPLNDGGKPTEHATRTPSGKRLSFKETIEALKKRHPKGHNRLLYFHFVNPDDAPGLLSQQSNSALLDRLRSKCDIQVKYVSANPSYTRFTVQPYEKTNDDQNAKIQHHLAAILGCHSHQLALSGYKYKVSLLFTNVKCIEYLINGTTHMIHPQSVLNNAIKRSPVQAWRDAEASIDSRPNGVRWGPRAPGSTTATLYVDLSDDYSYSLTRRLHDTILQFECGPRITHVAHVTIHNPDFNKVQCCNCSGPHYATDPHCPKRPNWPRNPAAEAFARRLQDDSRNEPFNDPSNYELTPTAPAPAGRTRPKQTSHLLQEHRFHYDVVCIQEPWYGPIKKIPSVGGKTNSAGPGDRTADDKYFGTQSDPDWYLLEHASLKHEKRPHPRVACYINRRLANARATIHPGIIHRDAMLVALRLSHDNTVHILNVYNSPNENSALLDFIIERITHHETELPDVVHCLGGDFNLHAPEWDPSWGSVIDLVWVPEDTPADRYHIDIDIYGKAGSDHALISTLIPVPDFSFLAAPRVSNDSLPEFLQALGDNLSPIFTEPLVLSDPAAVDAHATKIYETITSTWDSFARPHKYSPRSRPWWNQELAESKKSLSRLLAESTPPWQRKNIRRALPPHIRYSPEFMNQTHIPNIRRDDERRAFERAAILRHKARSDFYSLLKRTRNQFFEQRIYEIASKSKRVWDLMPWVRTRAIPDYLGLKSANGLPITSRDAMWQAFNSTFHSAQDRAVDMSIVNELPQLETRDWNPFSVQELMDSLSACAAKSAPGWDHMSWSFLKHLTSPRLCPDHYLTCKEGFLRLFNACFSLGLWPDEFRRAVTVVIPKPGKDDYTKIKSYRPIVLLSTIAKWMEKVINERIQYDAHKYGIMHPCQFGSAWQRSTVDAVTYVTNHIQQAWRKKLVTTMVGFDVAQFFPSINHDLLIAICERRGFAPIFIRWLRAYFLPRSSSFRFGNDFSPPFACPSVGVGQGSSLSPTFSGIAASPLMYILHHHFRSHSEFRHSYFHMYVDDGNIMVTSPSIHSNLRLIAILYDIVTTTLHRSGLVLEHEKTEAIHFVHTANSTERQLIKTPIPLPGVPHPIIPSDHLRHLGFWLDPHLSWKYHVNWYAHRAKTTTEASRMLGSSTRGLLPYHRRQLYISCVLPVLTYGCQVWFREKGVKHLLKRLSVAQNLALRWITGHFRTAPTGSLETKAGILPIHLYCRRLQASYRLRIHTLMPSHPIKSLFPSRYPLVSNSPHSPFYPPLRTPRAHIYHTALGSISSLPHIPESPLENAVCDTYDPTDNECQPGNRVIDVFADRIHLNLDHPPKRADDDAIAKWIQHSLQPRIHQAHDDPYTIAIYTDGSAKTDGSSSSSGFVAYYPAYTVLTEQAKWSGRGFSFDAELIAILEAVSYLISSSLATYHLHIFTDSESAAKTLFHTKSGRQQLLSLNATLRTWFLSSERNHLYISYCPSHMGIEGNERVDRLIANLSPPPHVSPSSLTHFSFEKRRITVDTIAAWTASTTRPNPLTGLPEPDPTYWGHDFLHSEAAHVFNPASASSFIRRFGKMSIVTFARLARVLNNHTFTEATLSSPNTSSTWIPSRRSSPSSLNPGAFSAQDAPPDTSDWADDEVDPRLELLINLVADLALRHDDVLARLPVPGPLSPPSGDQALRHSSARARLLDPSRYPAAHMSKAAAIHSFKQHARSQPFRAELLPLLELAHEFKQESRLRRHVKALRARGHKYALTDDAFCVLRKRLLRLRPGRKSRSSFRREGSRTPVPAASAARRPTTPTAIAAAPRALSPPSPSPSISEVSCNSDSD